MASDHLQGVAIMYAGNDDRSAASRNILHSEYAAAASLVLA
jgi:hypothetical protein